MSETVQYRGKLKDLKIKGQDIEDFAKKEFEKYSDDSDISDYYDSFTEVLVKDGEYIVLDDTLYKVHSDEIDPDYDIFKLSKTEDGFDFEVKYYNGGCSLSEALDYGYERYQNENKV